MPADVRAIVRRLYEEVWNKRRFEIVSQIISPSHALNDSRMVGSAVGPDAYKRAVTQYIAAFPDLRFSIEDMVCEKDKVVVSWTITGTHKREFRGIPATNKKVSFDGITINYVSDGKIMDSLVSMDYFGLMQQLGAITEPARPKSAIAH
jgi:steroid delta-isomerase-like uncharacterized protein